MSLLRSMTESGETAGASRAAVEPSLAVTVSAIPVLTFCLAILVRRLAELSGHAANLGLCLAAAFLATGLGLIAAFPARRRLVVMVIAAEAVIAVAAALLFHRLPDAGFDAQSYHLPSVLRLLAGWRPMVEATDLTLSNSYPSGLWTVFAGFDSLFGFESGRAASLLLIVSAFGVAWAVFRRAGFSSSGSSGRTLILIANPVVISQILTALPDGPMYELALTMICSLLIMLEDEGGLPILLAGATLILLCNAKLTGVYFGGLALLVVGGLLLWRANGRLAGLNARRRQIGLLAAAGLVAIGFVGWRPYVTNVLDHRAIIYPPPSELGYKPGSASQVPANLDRAGLAVKLAALVFARTDGNGGPVEWKVPGVFNRHELSMASDTRNGGFGPFFGAATLLAFGALGWALVKGRGRGGFGYRRQVLFGLMAYGVLTTVLFPEPWWARFVPLAWLATVSAGWLALELRPGAGVRACAIGVAFFSLLNCAVAGWSAAVVGLASGRDIEDKLNRMAHDPKPVYLTRGTVWNAAIEGQHAAEDVWRRRLSDHGRADVVIIPRAHCREIESLSVDVKRCEPPTLSSQEEQR